MSNQTQETTKKPLLLLVDDVAENLQLLAQHLTDEYELAFAMTGAQALAMASELAPALILLDVMMPGLDGYETCRRLKQNSALRAIPVIFLTAKVETDAVVQGFAAGGVDYVAKPFRAAELRARVRTHVELNRLKSLLCVCAQCHKIRNDQDQWEPMDVYVASHTHTTFSHGYCPACYDHVLQSLKLA